MREMIVLLRDFGTLFSAWKILDGSKIDLNPQFLSTPLTILHKRLTELNEFETREFDVREKIIILEKYARELVLVTMDEKENRDELVTLYNKFMTTCLEMFLIIERAGIFCAEEKERTLLLLDEMKVKIAEKNNQHLRKTAYGALFQNRELKKTGWDVVQNPNEFVIVPK